MAVKEILDVLGENPTESVYSEGKDFVTKKIKLYIDKKKLENYVKKNIQSADKGLRLEEIRLRGIHGVYQQ